MKLFLTAAAAAALAASGAHATAIADGTFNPGDWSVSVYTNHGSSVDVAQVGAGGNPGAYRSVTDHTADASDGITNSILVGVNVYGGGHYNPGTQGALTSIGFSIDTFCDNADRSCFGEGQGAGFVIRQGGHDYIDVPFDTGSFDGWTTHAYTLNAADFGLLDLGILGLEDLSQHPDFTGAGGAMQFGFVNENSALNSGYVVTSYYDNFSTDLQAEGTAGSGGVPEPAAWALMLLGFGGLGAALRQRRRPGLAA